MKAKELKDQRWIRVNERLPEETHYHVDGSNYVDKRDRDWSESNPVLTYGSDGMHVIDWLRNGEWVNASRARKSAIESNWYDVVAWMPLPDFDEESDYMLLGCYVTAIPVSRNDKGYLGYQWMGEFTFPPSNKGVNFQQVNSHMTGHDDYLTPNEAYKAAVKEAVEWLKAEAYEGPKMACQ